VTVKIFDLVASIGNFSNTPAVLRVHEGLAEALSPVVTNFVGRPMRAPVPLERPFPRDFFELRKDLNRMTLKRSQRGSRFRVGNGLPTGSA